MSRKTSGPHLLLWQGGALLDAGRRRRDVILIIERNQRVLLAQVQGGCEAVFREMTLAHLERGIAIIAGHLWSRSGCRRR